MPDSDARIVDVDDLPKRGSLIAHESRSFVVNEISFAVKDPDPPDDSWIRLDGGRDRGIVTYLLRAIEVIETDTEETR